jgi:Kef-type K+ transport system membrane component KefB
MKPVVNFFKNNIKTLEILITVVSFLTSISGFFSNIISLNIILFIFFIGVFISSIIIINYLTEKNENKMIIPPKPEKKKKKNKE